MNYFKNVEETYKERIEHKESTWLGFNTTEEAAWDEESASKLRKDVI